MPPPKVAPTSPTHRCDPVSVWEYECQPGQRCPRGQVSHALPTYLFACIVERFDYVANQDRSADSHGTRGFVNGDLLERAQVDLQAVVQPPQRGCKPMAATRRQERNADGGSEADLDIDLETSSLHRIVLKGFSQSSAHRTPMLV